MSDRAHTHSIRARGNLVLLLVETGELEAALVLAQRVVELKRVAFGPDDVQVAIGAALSEAAPEIGARVGATVRALVDTLSADPRRARLYAETGAHDALRTRREEALEDYATLLMVDVLQVDPTDPHQRLRARLVVAGTTDVVSHWFAGDLALTRDELVADVTAIGLALTL